jgi:hypothetical protein
MTVLKRIFVLIWAALREIFDESAYQRFLARRGMRSSASAYGEFLAEMQHRRARRVRCC